MKILITGAQGFIGKNLTVSLEAIRDGKDNTTGLSDNLHILILDIDRDPAEIDAYCVDADFVLHLAGVNRPLKQLSGHSHVYQIESQF